MSCNVHLNGDKDVIKYDKLHASNTGYMILAYILCILHSIAYALRLWLDRNHPGNFEIVENIFF